jgi:hypothetical protein
VTSPERITDGWSQGPANVATPFDLFPTDLNWSDALTALVNGVPQGVQAPAFGASLVVDDLEAGTLLGAIGDPIAADVALIPFALFLGAGPISDAVEGTVLNLVNLIP